MKPADVAPMMRGSTFAGPRRALFCLWDEEVVREFSRGARSVLREWNIAGPDADALLSDALARAEAQIENNDGISVPAGFFERSEICGFLRTFGRSRARDHLRAIRGDDQKTKLQPVLADGSSDGGPLAEFPEPPPSIPDVNEALLASVRHVVQMNLAPARAFALGCLYVPELVDLAWFEHHRLSLARSPADTLALWQAWWGAHDAVTMNREFERLQHLAWILRTTHTGDWRAWVAAHPRDCVAYVNTLQRARARGIADAQALLA